MLRQALLAMAIVGGLAAASVEAGVRGGHFEGTLLYSDGTDSGYLFTDFAKIGDGFVEGYEGAGSDPETFPGAYQEIDLILISFWSATYDDFPDYEVSGISILGIISTYSVEELNGDDDYSGIVIRNGRAGAENAGK